MESEMESEMQRETCSGVRSWEDEVGRCNRMTHAMGRAFLRPRDVTPRASSFSLR
jgi:hypothetical protein